jgi:hypothetical protein
MEYVTVISNVSTKLKAVAKWRSSFLFVLVLDICRNGPQSIAYTII